MKVSEIEYYINEELQPWHYTFLTLLALVNGYKYIHKYIVKPIKQKIDDNKSIFWITDRKSSKIPDRDSYMYRTNEREAIILYAYNMGIKKGAKDTLYITSKTPKNKKVYLYEGKRSTGKINIVASGTYEEVCRMYGIELKIENVNISSRKEALNIAIRLIKERIQNYKYKNKGKFVYNTEKEDFINGDEKYITIYKIDLWDVFPNARQAVSDGDTDVDECTLYISNIIEYINNSGKLPKGYKLDNYGDWDVHDITLVDNNSNFNEGYNIKYVKDIELLN